MLFRRLLMYANYRKQASEMANKFNVVFVLGGPGAGKGTQCERIVKEFGYKHLSAGDLLRAERQKPESDVGQLIEHHICNGTIVPVEITCSLLEKAMQETRALDSSKNDFLVDGFPRNEDNLQGWNRQMGDKTNLQFVINFECDEKTSIERCLKRGQAGSGRSDDNMESLKKRIVTHNTSTKPIIDHYKELDLVRAINAARSKNKVFDDVKLAFAEKSKS